MSNEAAVRNSLTHCYACGAQLPASSLFCSQCGHSANPGAPPAPPPANALEASGRGRNAVHVFALAIAVLGVIVLLRYSRFQSVSQMAEALQPTHDQGMIDETVSIASRGFFSRELSVPAGASDVTLDGDISAGDAPDEAVDIYIFSEPSFLVWRNGYSAESAYESGRVSQANIRASLPSGAGVYYLVISNKASKKKVNAIRATLTLHYRSVIPNFLLRWKDELTS